MTEPQHACQRPQHPRIGGCLAISPHGASSGNLARADRHDCRPLDKPGIESPSRNTPTTLSSDSGCREFLPGTHITGLQQVSHFLLDRHALPRRTRSQIPVTIFPVTMRPERISEKVEPFPARLLDAGLRFVQSQPNPCHHLSRPMQGLRRITAAENHEIISVVNDPSLECFTPSGHPPKLQKRFMYRFASKGLATPTFKQSRNSEETACR